MPCATQPRCNSAINKNLSFASSLAGTIKCSNLCTEIIEYTSAEETAVCNLASIALPRFVRERGVEASREAKKLVGSLDAENRWVVLACSCPGGVHSALPRGSCSAWVLWRQ